MWLGHLSVRFNDKGSGIWIRNNASGPSKNPSGICNKSETLNKKYSFMS